MPYVIFIIIKYAYFFTVYSPNCVERDASQCLAL